MSFTLPVGFLIFGTFAGILAAFILGIFVGRKVQKSSPDKLTVVALWLWIRRKNAA